MVRVRVYTNDIPNENVIVPQDTLGRPLLPSIGDFIVTPKSILQVDRIVWRYPETVSSDSDVLIIVYTIEWRM